MSGLICTGTILKFVQNDSRTVRKAGSQNMYSKYELYRGGGGGVSMGIHVCDSHTMVCPPARGDNP